MNNIGDGLWTRKLNSYEELMHKCYDKGFMVIRYILVLNSKTPLTENIVVKALHHLYRQVPTLRLCCRQRNEDEIWFRNMDEERLDFEIYEEADYEHQKNKILDHTFDIGNGPLWRVKMFPSSQECPISGMKEDFPNQYNFQFCFQHSITDGMSNVAICNLFLKLLNDISGEKHINDEIQIGYHTSEDQWTELRQSIENEMTDESSSRFRESEAYYEAFERAINPFLKIFPFHPEKKSCIQSLHHDFDEDQARKMVTVSRSHGVTLNSFMSTVIAASVIEIVKSRTHPNELQEEYVIPNGQLTSTRRYATTTSSDSGKTALGCFATPVSVVTKVSCDILDSGFWDHARRFDVELKQRLKNHAPFEEQIYHKIIEGSEPKPDKFLLDDPKAMQNFTFVTSNVGNLAKIFPGTGDFVQATYLNRLTLVDKVYSVHELHTFRGKLLYSLDYNPRYIAKDKAQIWADTVVKIVNQIMKNN